MTKHVIIILYLLTVFWSHQVHCVALRVSRRSKITSFIHFPLISFFFISTPPQLAQPSNTLSPQWCNFSFSLTHLGQFHLLWIWKLHQHPTDMKSIYHTYPIFKTQFRHAEVQKYLTLRFNEQQIHKPECRSWSGLQVLPGLLHGDSL